MWKLRSQGATILAMTHNNYTTLHPITTARKSLGLKMGLELVPPPGCLSISVGGQEAKWLWAARQRANSRTIGRMLLPRIVPELRLA